MRDASWLFGDQKHADVVLFLQEEKEQEVEEPPLRAAAAAAATGADTTQAQPAAAADGDAGAKRCASAADDTLAAHAVVLMCSSAFCKAKLQNWAGEEDVVDAQSGADDQQQRRAQSSKQRVVLHVPRGQLGIGRRLVRAMYEAKPALGDLGADEVVQLLLLADRYEAPDVVEAAATAAGVDPTVAAEEGLDWALVLAAFDDTPDAPAPCEALLQAADAALQRQLGDLELVWAHQNIEERASKQRRLKELPFAALKALLASAQTRVASENTVFHTLRCWIIEQNTVEDDARVKELLGLLRVQHMTPHYARTVFCASALVNAHLSEQELGLAAMLPLVDVATTSLGGAVEKKHPVWLLAARPRSALADGVTLDWRLPLRELEGCVEEALAACGDKHELEAPLKVVWQGWHLDLSVACRAGPSARNGFELGVFLVVEQPREGAAAVLGFAIEAVGGGGGDGGEGGGEGGGGGVSRDFASHAVTDDIKLGDADFFGLFDDARHSTVRRSDDKDAQQLPSWADVAAALRGKGLVHVSGAEGGDEERILLRAKVTGLQ